MLKFDQDYSEYWSDQVFVPLIQKTCQFVFDFEENEDLSEFETAIGNFLNLKPDYLFEIQAHVFDYCRDFLKWTNVTIDPPVIQPGDVWQHVQFPTIIYCRRRNHGNEMIYTDMHCGCSWEEEHGLELTFVEGRKIARVGDINGHLTNSDAYDKPELENVIFVNRDILFNV